jgi:hypothetical protein
MLKGLPMKTAMTICALALLAGCKSQVIGGGAGGGDGGAGGGLEGNGGSGVTSSEAGPVTTVTSGPGGAGGEDGLGECTSDVAVSSGTGPDGIFGCTAEATCTGGRTLVECTSDGTVETCECWLDGTLRGTCTSSDAQQGCFFPESCCYPLLDGDTTPQPGPYGDCNSEASTAMGAGGTGETMCSASYGCTGGDVTIDCEAAEGAAAQCECKDGSGLLLGTCTQEDLTCLYLDSCCHGIFNP